MSKKKSPSEGQAQAQAIEWDQRRSDREAELTSIAFSFAGLEVVDAPSAAARQRFPSDFRGGPSPQRLHDGADARWWNGVPAAELHCMVSVYARDSPVLDRLADEVLGIAADTGTAHRLVRRRLHPPRRLHFGYLDGFSGPAVAWEDPAQAPAVDFRHFVLGYSTELIESEPRDLGRPGDAEAVAFARDGSYAAVRFMYQDVAAFNRFVAANAGELAARLGLSEALAGELLKEKMLGRRSTGEPLAPRIDGRPFAAGESFDYRADKSGLHCPFSAHVRVVNPRDQPVKEAHAPVPRLLRRGMPYGEELTGTVDDGVDRGQIGIFLCSSLRNQFEKLMDWINLNDFSPVFPNIRAQDPLLGNRDLPLASSEFVISLPDGEFVARGLTTFVRSWGTLYLLIPSLTALRRLAEA